MLDDLLEQAVELKARGQPFALATVVACLPPTSAKPGAKAIIMADGTLIGWVGGSCAEPVVTSEALKALRDGKPRLLRLAPKPEESHESQGGGLSLLMSCQSEGTLEIYVEPFLAKPDLFIIGRSPVAQSLATLGKVLGFSVCVCDAAAEENQFPDAHLLLDDLDAARGRITRDSFVVVATMGHYDEEGLLAAVESQARYIALVASPKRGKAILQYLREKGVPAAELERVKWPAGLNIGAATPEEVALSIIAEIVQLRRAVGQGEAREAESAIAAEGQMSEATDPVCGMTVDIANARYQSTRNGAVFYFCCLRCKEAFDQHPDKYAVQQPKR